MRRIGTGISSFSSFWKKNRFFLLFLTLFFLGALCGAWVIKVDFSEQEAEASRILSGFEQIRGSQGFLSNFWDSCRSVWLLLLVMFFLGFFALGVPVLFAVPFWKGMGMGYLIGYLYMTFSWEGAGYAALIIVLPCCFFILFFFYGWKESLFSAGSLFRYCWGESVHSQIENEKRKRYCFRFGVLALLFMLYAAFEALVAFLFCGIFHLNY